MSERQLRAKTRTSQEVRNIRYFPSPREEAVQVFIEQISSSAKPSLQPLTNGKSGDRVYVLEVFRTDSEPAGESSQLEPGRYILKLSRIRDNGDRRTESEKQIDAESLTNTEDFQRVPPVLTQQTLEIENEKYEAIVYEIAGLSLRTVAPASQSGDPRLERVIQVLFQEALDQWADSSQSADPVLPEEVISKCCGKRLVPSESPKLHRFASTLLGEGNIVRIGEDVLPNPLRLVEIFAKTDGRKLISLKGFLHNDLHAENVLVEFQKDKPDFWIIDFSMSDRGFVGYDQAYFELSQMLLNANNIGSSAFISTLDAIERNTIALPLSAQQVWLSSTIRFGREVIEKWIISNHRDRKEDIDKQFLLTRIAAGINWANKGSDESKKRLSLVYAAYYGRLYLKLHCSDSWSEMVGQPEAIGHDEDTLEKEIDYDHWAEIWDLVGRFDSKRYNFVLLTEPQRNAMNLEVMGAMPWSLVIDLDPSSSEDGILFSVEHEIRKRRGLHTSTGEEISDFFAGGTTWLMANGWISRDHPPMDKDDWFYRGQRKIREFAYGYHRKVNQKSTIVVVMPGFSPDTDDPHFRASRCVEILDEVFSGEIRHVFLGDYPTGSFQIKTNKFEAKVSVGSFLVSLAKTVATEANTSTPMLPSSDGWVAIDHQRLIVLEENIEVLHSAILDSEEGSPSTEFWKGRPPTWPEIAAGIDIKRDALHSMKESIDTLFDENTSKTITVDCVPGSGSTTLARRLAWDLRESYPTCIVKRWSEHLPARIATLHDMAQRSVLIIAESGDLIESKRQELVKEIAGRNIRHVLVYFRKSFKVVANAENSFFTLQQGSEATESKFTFVLSDPMSNRQDGDAQRFFEKYRSLTDDERRIQELSRITFDDTFARYRSPFFYGLITFQKDFLKIADYVSTHLPRLRRQILTLFEYMSVLTIFSNSGIPRSLLNSLVGLESDSNLETSFVLGDGPCVLVTEREGVFRINHQIIAEAVLERVISDKWRVDLTSICVDMINDFSEMLSQSSDFLIDLFREVFIERVGVTGYENEDRKKFSPVIECVSELNPVFGEQIFKVLTEKFPMEAHFWNHRGRFQLYRRAKDDLAGAEKFLEKAVALSPHDGLHYHTLGMVKRQRVRQLLNSLRTDSSVELLDRISGRFVECVDCFTKSRNLSPDSAHGYITHAQIILEVAEKIKSMNSNSFLELSPSVLRWVQEQIAIVHELLADASTLYSTQHEPDRFYVDCQASLHKLMGHNEEVIRTWEIFNASRESNSFSRRALALAYVERDSKGGWASLSHDELRRIQELCYQNIKSASGLDHDYKLWFESSIRLPDFDPTDALAILAAWRERTNGWRPYYYSFAIKFVRWLIGETDDHDFDEDLEKAQARYHGKRGISFLWIGPSASRFPLVSSLDMGSWDRRSEEFWGKSAQSRLLRVQGRVSEGPLRPQAGYINISRDVRAFFVPKDLAAGEHENDPISFYLGLSPQGPRAWKHEIGSREGLTRMHVGAGALEVPLFDTQREVANQRGNDASVKGNFPDRVKRHIAEFLAVSLDTGEEVPLSDLSQQLRAVFSLGNNIDAEIGMSFEDYLRSLPRFTVLREGDEEPKVVLKNEMKRPKGTLLGQVTKIVPEKHGFLIDEQLNNRFFGFLDIHRQDRKDLERGSVVTFVPALGYNEKKNEESLIAKNLMLSSAEMPEVINTDEMPREKLLYSLEAFVVSEARKKGELDLFTLVDQVRVRFQGEQTLEGSLEVTSLIGLIKRLEGVAVDEETGTVSLLGSEGQLVGNHFRHQQKGASGNTNNASASGIVSADGYALVVKHILNSEKIASEKGRPLYLSELGVSIQREFGPLVQDHSSRKVYQILGYKTLTDLVKSTKKLSVMDGIVSMSGPATPKRNANVLPNSKNTKLTKELFRKWIDGHLAAAEEAGKMGLQMTVIVPLANESFDVKESVYRDLGFLRLRGLIESFGVYRVQDVDGVLFLVRC